MGESTCKENAKMGKWEKGKIGKLENWKRAENPTLGTKFLKKRLEGRIFRPEEMGGGKGGREPLNPPTRHRSGFRTGVLGIGIKIEITIEWHQCWLWAASESNRIIRFD